MSYHPDVGDILSFHHVFPSLVKGHPQISAGSDVFLILSLWEHISLLQQEIKVKTELRPKLTIKTMARGTWTWTGAELWDLTWNEGNRRPDTEDWNTQKGKEGSGNTWRDTADTKDHDATGKRKTKHTEHGNTRPFKVKQETWNTQHAGQETWHTKKGGWMILLAKLKLN